MSDSVWSDSISTLKIVVFECLDDHKWCVWMRFEQSFVETRSINPDHNSFCSQIWGWLGLFCETFFYKLPSKYFLNCSYIGFNEIVRYVKW